jgi:uncharacterized protein YhfF/GNAT superfamily N-acetyltransferase
MTGIIRQAHPEDAAAIAAIHVRAWQVAYRGLLPDEQLDGLSVERREHFWRELLSGTGAPPVFVAAREDRLVGFCALATPSRDADASADAVAEITALYVDPDAWRSGAGRGLMATGLGALRAGAWRAVTLWIFTENRSAREFYARFGFAPDGAESAHENGGSTGIRLRATIAELPAVVCEFAFPGPLREALVAAVLSGAKTATSSLWIEWEEDGEALPAPGERETVIDSDGRSVAVIEIVGAEAIRLGDADLQLALDEGEGFRSVAEWRAAHERFWNDEVRPELRDPPDWRLDDDTLIVVQRFRLVEVLTRA